MRKITFVLMCKLWKDFLGNRARIKGKIDGFEKTSLNEEWQKAGAGLERFVSVRS